MGRQLRWNLPETAPESPPTFTTLPPRDAAPDEPQRGHWPAAIPAEPVLWAALLRSRGPVFRRAIS